LKITRFYEGEIKNYGNYGIMRKRSWLVSYRILFPYWSQTTWKSRDVCKPVAISFDCTGRSHTLDKGSYINLVYRLAERL